MDRRDTAADLTRLVEAVGELSKIGTSGPLKYSLARMIESYEYLFQRACPFRVGQSVRMTGAPEIGKGVRWGWIPYKDMLVEGATGVVAELECTGKGFRAGVVMDDAKDKGEFWLDEKFLEVDE